MRSSDEQFSPFRKPIWGIRHEQHDDEPDDATKHVPTNIRPQPFGILPATIAGKPAGDHRRCGRETFEAL